MKNARSTNKEEPVNTLHYAFHPIAVQFDKQYTHNCYLYLQKNLQILGKYELCPKRIGKSKRFYFQIPTAIQYYRIISESNLQFKLSFYIQKIRDNYRQQEYMQGKKADLKWSCENYYLHQENVHWIQVLFGVVKVKFYYLFVVGQTHQNILQSIWDYYKKNNIKATKIHQSNQNVHSVENYQGNLNSLQKMAQSSHRISQTIPLLLQSQSIVQEIKRANENNKQSKPNNKMSKINSLQSNVASSFISGQGSSKQEAPQKSIDQLNLKYTVSELQISKDIERKIKQSYQEAAESKVQQEENIEVECKHKFRPIVSANSMERTRQITASQYLNQRNYMVISPFYSHFKYWVIIIAIFVIFGTLIHLGPKKRIVKINHSQPAHENQHISPQNKKIKSTKKKGEKKTKPKSEKERNKSIKKLNKKK